jgi:hypothetical protein
MRAPLACRMAGAGAASLVLDVEEGRRSHAATPRTGGSATGSDRFQGQPYLTTESHFDHGTSVGYWRFIHVFEQHAAPCTLNACAEALTSFAPAGEGTYWGTGTSLGDP